MKKRTSVLIEDSLLKRARIVLGAPTNTDAITKALRAALAGNGRSHGLQAHPSRRGFP